MTIATNPAGGAGAPNNPPAGGGGAPNNPPAGAGGAPPAGGGDPPAGGKGDGGKGGGESLESLRAKIATLEAAEAARTKAAEEEAAATEAERQAKLSEAQKMQEKLSQLEAKQKADADELRKTKLDAAAERLGVKANYRQYLPDVDPSDPAGAGQLETWAREHPEAVQARGSDLPPTPNLGNKLTKILSGEEVNPYLPTQLLKKLLG